MPEIVNSGALEFVTDLQRRFAARRADLLVRRVQRQGEIARSGRLEFLAETKDVREADWHVPPPPPDLTDRRVEIVGPADRRAAIAALNSTAKVWLVDLASATAPHWPAMIDSQANLYDAVRRTIIHDTSDGLHYTLRADRPLATIMVQPRGLRLDEPSVVVDGDPAAATLVDVGLYLFHNARELLARGSGPYLSLPAPESHLEARWFNDVVDHAEDALGIPRGTIRVTASVETVPAAFEMDEILHELGPHAAGLACGRWGYLRSIVTYFPDSAVLPDRTSVSMTAPFMRAYTELLVATCHRRGAYAIGTVATFVPGAGSGTDAAALAKIREEKGREVAAGFDGSRVADPKLVPICQDVFDAVLGQRRGQLDRVRDDVMVVADQLLDFTGPYGETTSAGLSGDIAVALRHLEAELRGAGTVTVDHLVVDAATAGSARAQVWQWLRRRVRLADSGEIVTVDLVRRLVERELARVRDEIGEADYDAGRFDDARALFERIVLAEECTEFVIPPAGENRGREGAPLDGGGS